MHCPSLHLIQVHNYSGCSLFKFSLNTVLLLSSFSFQLWTLKCLCWSRITYSISSRQLFTLHPHWLKSSLFVSPSLCSTELHLIPSVFSSLVPLETQHFSHSVSHYDRIQLLVLFIGGRKLVSFGKVSLRLRNAGLRRLGRFACCRSSLNTSTTLAFSFAEASR